MCDFTPGFELDGTLTLESGARALWFVPIEKYFLSDYIAVCERKFITRMKIYLSY